MSSSSRDEKQEQPQHIAELQQSLRSIYQHGLVPLSDIPREAARPNAALGTNETLKSICVNRLDLRNLSDAKRQEAIKIAVFEEYTGIAGIALERQWRFHNSLIPEIFTAELAARLESSVVFVLKPPTIVDKVYDRTDGYQTSNARRGLLNSDVMLETECIAEIKTVHRFKLSEILAILVPETLLPYVQQIFGKLDCKIVSVKMKQDKMRLPIILEYLHQEKIKHTPVLVPDYESALVALTASKAFANITLHTVRLHTQFDFVPMYIEDLNKHSRLLALVEAKTIQVVPDGSGWVSVHKSTGTSKQALLFNLRLRFYSDPARVEQFRKTFFLHQSIYEKLATARGCYVEIEIYDKLSSFQLLQLKKNGATVYRHPPFYSVGFEGKREPSISRIIQSTPACAAEEIQKIYRGHHARVLFSTHKQNLDRLRRAQIQVQEAMAAVNQSEAKLRSR